MWEIREYFKNIIIIMGLFLPFYYLLRFKVFKHNSNNKKREVIMLIFVLYMIALTSQAILPKFIIDIDGIHIIEKGTHKLNVVPFKFLKDIYDETIIKGNIVFFLINIMGNTLLFVPIGICLPYLWNISYNKVMLIGLCYTIFIETMQMFMPRVSDVDDIILNCVGVEIGVIIYNFAIKKSM